MTGTASPPAEQSPAAIRHLSSFEYNLWRRPLNAFDLDIVHYFNGFARQWPLFDRIVGCVESNDIFKGGVIIPIFWWLWFKKSDHDESREYLLSTIMVALAALLAARLLASVLPFRSRPIYDQGLHFVQPYGVQYGTLEGWSSFPSDHAVYFFALATGIAIVSRRLGTWLLLYTLVMICLPRVYFGFHYPTDIIAGAVIGTAAGGSIRWGAARKKLTSIFLLWERESPEVFYCCFFYLTFQMIILFYSFRDLAHRLLFF
jgi:undecaprenyl-diphosphatase